MGSEMCIRDSFSDEGPVDCEFDTTLMLSAQEAWPLRRPKGGFTDRSHKPQGCTHRSQVSPLAIMNQASDAPSTLVAQMSSLFNTLIRAADGNGMILDNGSRLKFEGAQKGIGGRRARLGNGDDLMSALKKGIPSFQQIPRRF